jgi:hypothetical protein
MSRFIARGAMLGAALASTVVMAGARRPVGAAAALLGF